MCLDLNRNKTLQLRHWHNAYFYIELTLVVMDCPKKRGFIKRLTNQSFESLRIIFWCTCYHALAFAAECNKHTGACWNLYILIILAGWIVHCIVLIKLVVWLLSFPENCFFFSLLFNNNNKNNKNLACLCEQFRTLQILITVPNM